MRIVVLIKQVPDTYGDRTLSLETGLAARELSERVLDEIDERAIEVALAHRDRSKDTTVTVVTMGPPEAEAAVRRGLSIGADSGVHLVEHSLVGADAGLTAEVLSVGLKEIGFDLVLCGDASSDGAGGIVPAMVAELLGVSVITSLSSIEVLEDRVRGTREVVGGSMTVSTPLPAVVSITERLPEARFPNLKDVMASKKRAIETHSAKDLAIDADDLVTPRSIVLSVRRREERQAGVKLEADDTAIERLAELLVGRKLV